VLLRDNKKVAASKPTSQKKQKILFYLFSLIIKFFFKTLVFKQWAVSLSTINLFADSPIFIIKYYKFF